MSGDYSEITYPRPTSNQIRFGCDAQMFQPSIPVGTDVEVAVAAPVDGKAESPPHATGTTSFPTTVTWWKFTINTPSHTTLTEWGASLRVLAVLELFSTIMTIVFLPAVLSHLASKTIIASIITNFTGMSAITWLISAIIAYVAYIKAQATDIKCVLQYAVQHTIVGIVRAIITVVLFITTVITLISGLDEHHFLFAVSTITLFASISIHVISIYVVILSILSNRYVTLS